ncbi:MAG: hypothetical protein R3C53_02885 [Pirellulaceae bacterium]
MKTDSAVSPYESGAEAARPPRLASIDAYRGLVMFLMLAEVLELMTLKKSYPDSRLADWVNFHTTHVAWVGCSLHDMIQPSFSFLVGVSLPFSLAARQQRGSSFGTMALHALWRSLVLIALGIALRSIGKSSINYFFCDTLTQIGLGYFALFLLGNAARWVQALSIVVILGCYWAWFALTPVVPPDFDLASVGVPADWPHQLSGFAAHWNKNANPAFAFDQWFMNLFPREEPFKYDSGGYLTLNFIPTLATMLLGTLAGGVLQRDGSMMRKSLLLFLPGLLMLAVGWSAGYFGICPVVKRIWTPAWVLYSGGICFLTLGGLYLLCDVAARRAWAWPLMVIGANSILAYVMSWTLEKVLKRGLENYADWAFRWAGETWEPVLIGATVLLAMWLILWWLFRQRLFVRI